MFEKLKQKSLQKHTDRNLETRDLSGLNSKLKTLGFLVDELVLQEFDELFDFYRVFELQPKDVKVFSFVEFKKNLPTLRQNQIHNKEFSWKGEIQNRNALEFLDREFDILVGWYQGKHPFLDLMISRSKAKFKVGLQNTDQRLFDLLLALSPNETEAVKSELKKYTTVLNK